MRIILTLLLLYAPLFTRAQPWFSTSIDIEEKDNSGWQVIVDEAQEELLLVSPNRCDTTYSRICTIIARTDWAGNLLGHAQIDTHIVASVSESLIKVSDSTYYMYARPSPAEEENVQILKLNQDFTVEQEWNFGAETEEEIPYYWAKHEEGYLTASITVGEGEPITTFSFLNDSMEILHQAMYPESESPYGIMSDNDLIATQDGNFVSSGLVRNNEGRFQGFTKFTPEMEVLWHSRLEEDDFSRNNIAKIVELNNGNIATNWEEPNLTDPLDVTISFINLRMAALDGMTGDTVWTNTLWMTRPAYPYVIKLNRANNGDIIGIGYISRPPVPEEWEEIIDNAGFIFRMSPEGELKWKRYIFDDRSPLAFLSYFNNGAELPNGDLVFTGTYQDTFPNQEPFINNINIWLVRTDSMGCLVPGCGNLQIVTDSTIITSTREEVPTNTAPQLMARAYPNPTTDHWVLDWGYASPAHLQLTDMQGRVLKEAEVRQGQQDISAEGLPPGIYILVLHSAEVSGSLKVVKR